LQQRGLTAADAIAAGLAVQGERGVYDRFRHRLMFAIRDERGRVAGFGGRTLPGEALGAGEHQPKYVNTPQSAVFDKSAILYALDLARDAIRSAGEAVIVEGYMDAIAAHEHGHANVVASMGTSLTERQVALLKRYTRNVILALDADAAGGEATLRGVQVVATAADHEYVPVPNWRGVIRHQDSLAADIRVLTMPAGRDPDDVIRSSAELWPELVREAKPVLDHLFDAAAARHDLTSPRGRSAAAAELLPLVAAVTDRVVQSHYLQRLARIAQTDEATLRLDMRQPARSTRRDAAGSEGADPTPAGASAAHDRKEEFCLALLFRYPELLAEGTGMDPELFGQSENRALFQAWADASGEKELVEQSLAADLRPQYERISAIELLAYDSDGVMNALRSTVRGIEQRRLRLAKRVSAAAFAGVDAGDSARVAELARGAWLGAAGGEHAAGDESERAAAFVEDMEAGLKIHQHLLEDQRSDAGRGGGR
jgi:DNA primase